MVSHSIVAVDGFSPEAVLSFSTYNHTHAVVHLKFTNAHDRAYFDRGKGEALLLHGCELVSELTAIQDPPYRLNLFYSPDAMFEAVVRLTANQVTIKVLPRVALGLNAYTNGESNTLTIDYSKGHYVKEGMQLGGRFVPFGEETCFTQQDMQSYALSEAQCYKEVCLGNACTKFPCISSNIYVRYNETNDRITSLEAGYENALFYDGEKLFGVNATDTLAPGQVRESHFHFRFGTQFESKGLETVYGGYPEDGVPFWPDWDCKRHNISLVLEETTAFLPQGWVTMSYCGFGCPAPPQPPSPPLPPSPPRPLPPPPFDCYHPELEGTSYRGAVARTLSGYECLAWSRVPLSGTDPRLYDRFPWLLSSENLNFCRNPDNSTHDKPWCFTVNASVAWEYCDVPRCELPSPPPPPAPPPLPPASSSPSALNNSAPTNATNLAPPSPPTPQTPLAPPAALRPPPPSAAMPSLPWHPPPPPPQPPKAPGTPPNPTPLGPPSIVDLLLKFPEPMASDQETRFREELQFVLADMAGRSVDPIDVVVYDISRYDGVVTKSLITFQSEQPAKEFEALVRCCVDFLLSPHHFLGRFGTPLVLEISVFIGTALSPPPSSRTSSSDSFVESNAFIGIIVGMAIILLLIGLILTQAFHAIKEKNSNRKVIPLSIDDTDLNASMDAITARLGSASDVHRVKGHLIEDRAEESGSEHKVNKHVERLQIPVEPTTELGNKDALKLVNSTISYGISCGTAPFPANGADTISTAEQIRNDALLLLGEAAQDSRASHTISSDVSSGRTAQEKWHDLLDAY